MRVREAFFRLRDHFSFFFLFRIDIPGYWIGVFELKGWMNVFRFDTDQMFIWSFLTIPSYWVIHNLLAQMEHTLNMDAVDLLSITSDHRMLNDIMWCACVAVLDTRWYVHIFHRWCHAKAVHQSQRQWIHNRRAMPTMSAGNGWHRRGIIFCSLPVFYFSSIFSSIHFSPLTY